MIKMTDQIFMSVHCFSLLLGFKLDWFDGLEGYLVFSSYFIYFCSVLYYW